MQTAKAHGKMESKISRDGNQQGSKKKKKKKPEASIMLIGSYFKGERLDNIVLKLRT